MRRATTPETFLATLLDSAGVPIKKGVRLEVQNPHAVKRRLGELGWVPPEGGVLILWYDRPEVVFPLRESLRYVENESLVRQIAEGLGSEVPARKPEYPPEQKVDWEPLGDDPNSDPAPGAEDGDCPDCPNGKHAWGCANTQMGDWVLYKDDLIRCDSALAAWLREHGPDLDQSIMEETFSDLLPKPERPTRPAPDPEPVESGPCARCEAEPGEHVWGCVEARPGDKTVDPDNPLEVVTITAPMIGDWKQDAE